MRKALIGWLGVALVCMVPSLHAQVSHGGRPLPLSSLRSSSNELFVTMPSFDLEAQLRLDSLNMIGSGGAFPFAYKFMTDYSPENSGESFTLGDGTKVWRIGIYSPGALSVNLLFSEYELPEGAQLFVYNEDQSQVLGSFNHLNNSENGVLPIAPIRGDRVIVEYQEPAGVSFHARLRLGEVNHAYRELRGAEPSGASGSIAYIPSLTCFDSGDVDYRHMGRSTVLLIVDGIYSCTGVLLNNVSNDGKPYLLTASHCLNNNFKLSNPDYAQIAGTIVSFFNYNSPLCDTLLRGTEELSVASSYYRAVNEMADMALLELAEMPPIYYQPYLAGWRVDGAGSSPYVCVQHPLGADKRVSVANQAIEEYSFVISEMVFYDKAHWRVPEWNVGYTANGSSGSPLFNGEGLVIGSLSGGSSTYQSPVNDYFYRLGAAWDRSKEANRQLACWLDPLSTGNKICEGLDPYLVAPCERLSNVTLSGSREKVECTAYASGSKAPLFGNNGSGVMEYAEEYRPDGRFLLYGAYIVTPAAGSNYRLLDVDITVYSGASRPEELLHVEHFQPSYTNKSLLGDSFVESDKSLNRSQESFVRFERPIEVNGPFYIGYRINSSPADTYFSAYNLPKGATARNSAWARTSSAWVEATNLPSAGFSTALFIDPVIQYIPYVDNESIPVESAPIVVSARRGAVEVFGAQNASYELYSMEGKRMAADKIKTERALLDFSALSSGIYLLRIEGKSGVVSHKVRL